MAWAPDYVTSVDLGDYLKINDLDDDLELALAVSAASRAVDHVTNRQFGKTDGAETRQYTARPDYERGYWVVDVDDFIAVTGTGVAVADSTPVTGYDMEPVNAEYEGRPWHRIAFNATSEAQPSGCDKTVTVEAMWGWAAVPDTVKQATLVQAGRFYKRRVAPFGVAGSPDQGSEMRLLAKVDPDVAVMLRSYARTRSVF